MKNIAVIGAGTMGNGIVMFLHKVFKLILYLYRGFDKALATIEKNLDRTAKKK